MTTMSFAIPLSILAFFAAGIAVAGLIGPTCLSFWAAIAAAVLTWHHLKKVDTAELARLLEGHHRTWAVPYPVAYGCVKDTLTRSKMSIPGTDCASWQIIKEDDREGSIIAVLNLSERFAAASSSFNVPASLTASFRVAPNGDSTQVLWSYQGHCPLATLRLKQAINALDQALHSAMSECLTRAS